MPPTLGTALLCSSRVGSDTYLLSRNSIVHRDWGKTIGVCVCVCVCSFVVVVGFVELYIIQTLDINSKGAIR